MRPCFGNIWSSKHGQWYDQFASLDGLRLKKPKLITGKSNLEAQIAFVKENEQLKQDILPDDQIYIRDGVQSNTSRERINIIGAVNIESL